MSDLTVVIPTWNQCGLLQNCLLSLHKQSRPCRILVVDNGSSDATQELIRDEQERFSAKLGYINLGRNLGFAHAANEGIKIVETDFLALLNNDTEADRCWVEAGVRGLEAMHDYSVFASRIVNFHRRTELDSAGDGYSRSGIPYKRGYGQATNRFAQPEPVLGASAAAAFYRRGLFNDVGLFDEDFFMYLEDVDLSLRAQLLGHRCWYLPDAIVYHIEAASDPDYRPRRTDNRQQPRLGVRNLGTEPFYSRNRVYWITRNRWQLMITYQPVRHLPWVIYGWMRSGVFHLLKAGFFGSFLRGLGAGMLRTASALRQRLVLRRRRVLSTRALCTLMRTGKSG